LYTNADEKVKQNEKIQSIFTTAEKEINACDEALAEVEGGEEYYDQEEGEAPEV
jgi:hypothetical protein